MVRPFRHCRRDFSFLIFLFFSISWNCKDPGKRLLSSGTHNAFRLYSPESVWVLDLDGDNTPNFAGVQRLGPTKDGYFYRFQLRLSSATSPSSFIVFDNSALGLTIRCFDIDGDDDIDLSISDRFLSHHVGIWLNDGNGRFVKSPPGLFSPNSNADIAFAGVGRNFVEQPTGVRERRRLPDYLAATPYIPPLPLKTSALNRHPLERTVHFAADSLSAPRSPPTALAV
jgi:hypothetical protein